MQSLSCFSSLIFLPNLKVDGPSNRVPGPAISTGLGHGGHNIQVRDTAECLSNVLYFEFVQPESAWFIYKIR